MSAEQLELFPAPKASREERKVAAKPPLTSASPLSAAMRGFHQHMIEVEFSPHTIRSFSGDLSLLARYLGADTAVGEISIAKLRQFLHWLRYERGVPCNAKSLSRRLTTLKVFFGWLQETGVLIEDPAAPLVHQRVSTPLPHILTDTEVERVLQTTEMLLHHPDEPDARPHLLVTLLLHTGIKKSECMNIALHHIETGNPGSPVLYIRYENPRQRYKERRLRLPSSFVGAWRLYLDQYKPRAKLFECTARNLEYVLHNVARQAGIEGGISFESLRWTCAVRDYRGGMDEETLRRKMGLSTIAWPEVLEKIKMLVQAPL